MAWSTYGVEAPATFTPEFKDALAITSTSAFNALLAPMLPLAVVATLGFAAVAHDSTGIVYLVDVLNSIVGTALADVLVLCLIAGLLLTMDTGIMGGSRALYGMARERLTIKQLGVLNRFHVPARAITVDLALNSLLLFLFPSIFFTLAAGNLGYILAHVLALTGVIILRRDRPSSQRPFRLQRGWIALAGILAMFDIVLIGFGLAYIELTGYAWNDSFTNPTANVGRIIIVGILVLVAGIAGYAIAQHQHDQPFRWRERVLLVRTEARVAPPES